MVRAMESPIPMPCCFVVKKGSNTSAIFSTGMPGPESEIAIPSSLTTTSMIGAFWSLCAGQDGSGLGVYARRFNASGSSASIPVREFFVQ